MGNKLETGYTKTERENFIVEFNHQQGMKITENEYGIFATSANEEVQNGEIINISNTPEYRAFVLAEQNEQRKAELKTQISELDLKRIRAGFEPAIKDETTGETYLQYYTNQIIALRNELNEL